MRELPVYEFGDVRVDLRRMGVWRAGRPVPLEPKTFDVLRFLIENRERLVAKDELLDVVWHDTFVTPNVLTRAVAQLRKGIGDDAHEARYVETVAKRGYRFIAPVTVLTGNAAPAGDGGQPAATPASGSAAPPRRRRRWGVIAVVVIAAAGLVAGVAIWWTGRHAGTIAPAPAIERLTSSGTVIDATISPDGQYIAYVELGVAEQTLWVRQLRGGNPLQLVPPASVGYWGITFARDSSSLYYVIKGAPPLGDFAGVLYQVPILGGTPRRLTTRLDSQVAVSPDGSRIAYLQAELSESAEPGASALVVSNADGTNPRALLSKRPPEFLAPGFFMSPTWSPDGSRIATPVRSIATRDVRLATVDVQDGSETYFPSRFVSLTNTWWLPDGSGILFAGKPLTSTMSEFGGQIWLQPYPDGPVRRITQDLIEYRRVTTTADGELLVAVGMDSTAGLWVQPLDGESEPRRLPSMKYDGIGGLGWLGADRIVFAARDVSEPQIWTMNLDGTSRRQLTTEGWNWWPRPSPDQRTIYFASNRSGQPAIWRMNADGGGARKLADVIDAWHLTVSPDDRWIVFSSTAQGSVSTWKVPAEGGTPTLVARLMSHAAISPDGRFVAGIWRQTPASPVVLAVLPLDGGEPVHTFSGPYTTSSAGSVNWTPDGRALLVTTTERANVWRQPIDGGDAVAVTNFLEGSVFRFDRSPDGRALLVCRGAQARDAFLLTGF